MAHLPIIRFNVKRESVTVQDLICSFLSKINPEKCFLGLNSTYLSELIDNIDQHSNSEYGYVFVQFNKMTNRLNICLADDGITIYNSYIEKNLYLKEICENEGLAMKKAFEGVSSKGSKCNERGFGLSGTSRLFCNGLTGDLCVLSGCGFYRSDSPNRSAEIYNIADKYRWNGTLILLSYNIDRNIGYTYTQYYER